MRYYRLTFIITMVVLGCSRPLFSRTVKKVYTSRKSQKSNFEFLFDTSFETALYSENGIKKSSSYEKTNQTLLINATNLSTQYSISKVYSIDIQVGFSKDLSNTTEKIKINDTNISLQAERLLDLKSMNLKSKLTMTIPTSENSIEVEELKTAIKLSFYLKHSMTKKINLLLSSHTQRRLHRYESNISGESNNKYIFNNGLTLSYKISPLFQVHSRNFFAVQMDYTGQDNQLYSLAQSLEISMGKNTSLEIGHSVGGNALTQNRADRNILLIDQERSSLFFNINHKF